jgi:hypothetical protein
MAAKDISELELGPIGDRVMYENALVRVWISSSSPARARAGTGTNCRT